ncbi:MAG: DNA polymerase III subunit alpha, partial [Alphaproteobacteria bacterium]
MSHADFVHLRVHSAYSLSRGALSVKDLVKRCRSEGMPAVAVTDTGNLFGALEFSQAAAGAGVQPIIGCDIGIRREAAPNRPGAAPSPDRIALLAQNAEGYANLLKLVSHAYMQTEGHEEPQIDLDDLEAHAGGLILLTGGPAGPVGRLLLDGQAEAAEEVLARLVAAFPDRLYIEIMRHGQEAEERTEDGFIDLAYRHDLPLVATNDVYFADEGMYEAHDVLLCIGQNATLAHQDRWRVTPEHRFKSAAEMREAFADLPEAIRNTLVVAQRCAVMAESRDPILPAYPELGGKSEADKLREMAEAGLAERLRLQVYTEDMDEAARQAVAKPYRDRLALELETIIAMGFPGYFLIVADFIQWSKAHGVAVGPGRGSGAGSVVAWALTITDLDPLRWGLLFERFLNPERVSMPDFDIDFCKDRRDEVIRYVQDKYGHDRVAQIITFGKLEARAALRDVGRVLGLPYGQVDRICKLVPNNPANPVKLKDAIEGEPALQRMRDEDPDVARLIRVALKLEGLYRHASTHAAGVVIGDRPLDALVPLYRDPRSDMPVTQFNMKFVEKAGLVKFDFLGLKTLTVLEHAVRLLAERGVEIDLAALPLDDAPTYAMMCKGDTTGVFQIESSGMRDVLRKLKPDRFEDIIAVVALYRPGPMDNIPSYIRR